MDSANSVLLNRFFTRNSFRQVVEEGESPIYSAVIRRYVSDDSSRTNRENICEIYQYLKRKYQNEYYYKNTLINKLLPSTRNLHTTTALTEVPVGNSKADFILINGKAVVYEIKTALDNFERLDGQIADYYKAFSRVMVVTSENNFKAICDRLQSSPVGICILTSRGTLSIRKQPDEYKEALSLTTMFKMLRKEEYEQIIREYFGYLPDVSQFVYYRTCQSLFESMPLDTAYQAFIHALKLRVKIETELYSQVPYELKFLVYFSNYKARDYFKLSKFLNT